MPEESNANLEKYLTEPIALMTELPQLKEKIAEYTQQIQSIAQYEQESVALVNNLKNPQLHSGPGVLSLYGMYKSLSEKLEGQKTAIGNGYEIIVNGIKTPVTPEKTINIWQYRLGWLEKALEGLAFIYKDDIKKAIEESQKLTDEMTKKFKL